MPERASSASPAEGTLRRETPGGSAEPPGHDPYAALRLPNYRHYIAGNAISAIGMQMAGVVIGWELYLRTNSALALGLVGLCQIIPIISLALVTGQIIDRFNRKTIIIIDQACLAFTGTCLGLASLFHNRIPAWPVLDWINAQLGSLASWMGESGHHFHDRQVPIMFGLLFLNGIIRSFNQPAKQSLLPQLVPPSVFPNAVTWNSSIFEICGMAGPALGGFAVALIAWGVGKDSSVPYASVYFVNAACQLAQLLLFVPITLIPMHRPREPLTMRSLLAGIRFVWDTRVILATMSLDMFAVLLGGATALLPIFAKDILHVGPAGLGWLRAAPSIGAFCMAMFLAHRRPMRHAGRNLLLAVAGFGMATILFGATGFVPAEYGPTWGFGIAMVALFLTGVTDNISVVIRHTLVQILTPDRMRGRVSAVNSMFIASSNELGALESGTVAALFGPVVSVISGGMGTIVVVGVIALLIPQVRRLGALKDIRPAEEAEPGGFPVEAAKAAEPKRAATPAR